MWTSQHTVLYYSFTVYNIASYLDYLDIYILCNHCKCKIEFSLQELTHVLQQYSNSFIHDDTIKQINW